MTIYKYVLCIFCIVLSIWKIKGYAALTGDKEYNSFYEMKAFVIIKNGGKKVKRAVLEGYPYCTFYIYKLESRSMVSAIALRMNVFKDSPVFSICS